MQAFVAPCSTSLVRPRGKSPSSIKSKPTTLSASCWFGLTSEGFALSAALSTDGGESTTVYSPRSLARRTRSRRKRSSRFGGTLPAKTTAVAYSIRCSRRLENSLASAWVTSGPYSLISVCVPAIGSTMAVEVRECPSISTRSNGMAASERPLRMASPLRPPANPAARTGTSRVRKDRATFTPFPPASVMLSGARWRWPSVRLGTTSVLATAALRVMVSIMPLPTYFLFENPLHGIPHPLSPRGLFVAFPGDQRGLPDLLPIHPDDDLTELRARPSGVRQVLHQIHIALDVGARVHEALHVILRQEIDGLLPPVGHVDAGITFALDDEVRAVVGAETVLQCPYRGREAVFSGIEEHAHVRLVSDGGRGYQGLPRGRGRPRLDACGRPVGEQQLVGVGEWYLPVRGVDGRVLRRDYLPELGVLHR